MIRLITPIILIVLSIAGFLFFVGPTFGDISDLRNQVSSYSEALENAKTLEAERDRLTAKYNSVDADNLQKLQKLLPDSVDNIRLILEIEKVAMVYGMVLRDVRYDAKQAETIDDEVVAGGEVQMEAPKDYGVWDLSFSVQGTYTNFVNFLKDLEKNLRIVDVSSVQFSSDLGTNVTPGFAEVYKYAVKIKTYWLKN